MFPTKSDTSALCLLWHASINWRSHQKGFSEWPCLALWILSLCFLSLNKFLWIYFPLHLSISRDAFTLIRFPDILNVFDIDKLIIFNNSVDQSFSLSLFVKYQSVQLLSHVQLFATPWIAAWQADLSITSSWSSFKLTSIELVTPSSHLILCRPLFLLPPIPPSIRVFSNESTLRMRWPKYWNTFLFLKPHE